MEKRSILFRDFRLMKPIRSVLLFLITLLVVDIDMKILILMLMCFLSILLFTWQMCLWCSVILQFIAMHVQLLRQSYIQVHFVM